MQPNEGAILARLASGKLVSFDEFTDSLYGDREDGGPIDPNNVIAVTIYRLRKKLIETPLRIRRVRVGHYKLVEKLTTTLDDIAHDVLKH